MAKQTPEGKTKDLVKSIFAKYENLHFDMFVPGGYGRSGLDFTCCYHGRYFVVETKAPGQVPTERQNHDMRKVVAAGGRAFVVTGGDPHSQRVLVEWLNNIKVIMEH